MRWLLVVGLVGCAAPRATTVNVAALRDARFEASVSERGLGAMFVFDDDFGCPMVDGRMRASVNGEPVVVVSPQPDADAYPRGTPCVGYQLEVGPQAATDAEVRVWDASGEARVRIEDAFTARSATVRGDGTLVWTPASDVLVDGDVRVDGTVTAHAAIEACDGFASCTATASVRDLAIPR